MTISTTKDYCTIIEGVYARPQQFDPTELLHAYNCYGDYVYGTFIDIALKADVDFDFIHRLQRHIENIARVTGGSIDEDAMANSMACIWRRKSSDVSTDYLWDSLEVD